jgi:hypothetical protein
MEGANITHGGCVEKLTRSGEEGSSVLDFLSMDSTERDPVEDVEVERLLKLLDDAIRHARRSRREVERSLGLGQGYLGSLFKGRIELKVWHVYRLARELGLDPLTFFFEVSPPQDAAWVLKRLGYDPALLEKLDGPPLSPSTPAPRENAEGPLTRAELGELVRQAVDDELKRRGVGAPDRGKRNEPA